MVKEIFLTLSQGQLDEGKPESKAVKSKNLTPETFVEILKEYQMYNQVDKFLRPQNGGIFGFGYHCFKRRLVDVEFLLVYPTSTLTLLV